MADQYIDIEEMVRYGEYFVNSAAGYTPLDPYVTTLIASQQSVLDQLTPLILLCAFSFAS